MRSREFSFYSFITMYFGFFMTKMLKTWSKRNSELIKVNLRIRFLQDCRRHHLLPKHLNYHRFVSGITFYDSKVRHKFINMTNIFFCKVFRVEIDDAYKQRSILQRSLSNTERNIIRAMPLNLWNKFFYTQQRKFDRIFFRERSRLRNKFLFLINGKICESRERLSKLDEIEYACVERLNRINSQRGSCEPFEFIPNPSHNFQISDNIVHSVDISPLNFFHKEHSLLVPKKKWFVNLSSSEFPDIVSGLLQLGERFCLPLSLNREPAVIEFIKNIESSLRTLDNGRRIELRNRFVPLLEKFFHMPANRDSVDRAILSASSTTREFLANHPDILITKADKGNVVVALDKIDYIYKMESLLGDRETYHLVDRNPINSVINNLHELLKRWRLRDYISPDTYKFLNSRNPVLPRAYGLPKIHKDNCPLRVIVSSIGSPLHNLAAYLHKIIYKSLPNSLYNVSNSYELVKKIRNLKFDNTFDLISLDVVSLFPNVPVNVAVNGIAKRWVDIERNTSIPKLEFLAAVNLVLNSTFFMFNGRLYKQLFGAPMGSPLSPIVADVALQDLELQALNGLSFVPPFYFRYVDDIALAAPRSCFREVLDSFNSYHPRLQFTMEIGGNSLNFLDVMLIKEGDYVITDWYVKPTFSGRFLNYLSNHPFCHKKGTILSLVDRCFWLSHPKFHQKNLSLIIEILIDNGYPLDLIFTVMWDRLKNLFHKKTGRAERVRRVLDGESKQYLTVPYVASVSEKFRCCLSSDSELRLAYTGLNRLSKFVKVHKDPLPSSSQTDVVYRLNCKSCDASYVGQTKRPLKQRISEHEKHIVRNSTQSSVITNHRINCSHDFEWDKVMILDREKNYFRRLTSEMVHIKKQRLGLNLQSDTELLDPSYLPLVEKFECF